MPFPLDIPKQMPCPHWNHFPVVSALGSISGSSPPTPEHLPFCKVCRAASNSKPRPSF